MHFLNKKYLQFVWKKSNTHTHTHTHTHTFNHCLAFAWVLGLVLTFVTPIFAGECPDDDAGVTITGNDGTKYCQSKIKMNWWSAIAWCKSMNMELFEIVKECSKFTGPGNCPNLKGVTYDTYLWAINSYSTSHAYIMTTDGAIEVGGHWASVKNGNCYAFCS